MSKENSVRYDMKRITIKRQGHGKTRKVYLRYNSYFCFFLKMKGYSNRYVRKNYKIVVQEYADYLCAMGYAATTIHNYLTPVCGCFELNMSEIIKPIRYTANINNRRGIKNERGQREENMEKYARLVSFQKVVGIRREELKDLNKVDFVIDESGYYCVVVKRGKGGKYQLQRIHPDFEELIRSYFDGTEDRVFSKREINNAINLHKYRAMLASEMHYYYLEICKTAEGREKLKAEIIKRYKLYNMNAKDNAKLAKFKKQMEGTYYVRGGNKKFAIEKGKPIAYDKTAIMAVSVFHLSHWRNNVAIQNYILAQIDETMVTDE